MDPRIAHLRSALECHRADLREAFQAVPTELYDRTPGDGAWSVARIVEHLAMTERAVTGLVAGFVARAEARPEGEPFDGDGFAEAMAMDFFLDRSRKVTGTQPPGEMDAPTAWATLGETRQALLAEMEKAEGRRLEALSHDHPATGLPLDTYQWIAFVGLHEARHAAQIREVVERLTAGDGDV